MTPTAKCRSDDSAAHIRFCAEKVLESSEISPDIVFDLDAHGRIVGIELLDARSQLPPDLLIEAAQSTPHMHA